MLYWVEPWHFVFARVSLTLAVHISSSFSSFGKKCKLTPSFGVLSQPATTQPSSLRHHSRRWDPPTLGHARSSIMSMWPPDPDSGARGDWLSCSSRPGTSLLFAVRTPKRDPGSANCPLNFELWFLIISLLFDKRLLHTDLAHWWVLSQNQGMIKLVK